MTGDDWTKPEELAALAAWADGADYAVEVGTWTGRSAAAMLPGIRVCLFCVDHFAGAPEQMNNYPEVATPYGRQSIVAAWTARIEPWREKCRLLEMESGEAVEVVRKHLKLARLDFVFIDGDHREVAVHRDIGLWRPLVRPGGFVCGHDYTDDRVKAAVSRNFVEVQAGPLSLWRAFV